MRLSCLIVISVLALSACNTGFDAKGGGPSPVQGGGDDGSYGADGTDGSDGSDANGDGADGTDPTLDQDDDGDGFSVNDGDCDDADPLRYPGAVEACDGIDNDCDGVSDADFDRDTDGTADCEDFCPILVDAYAPAGGDGSHDRPLLLVQDGIDLSVPSGCYEVWVEEGTYYENIDFIGYPIAVTGIRGAALTTIDGGGLDSVAVFLTGEDRSSVLTGFTLTHGAGDRGAGIEIVDSSPTITDNLITDNATSGGLGIGGGVFVTGGAPLIEDNVISDNDACFGGPENGCDGGGVMAVRADPDILGNDILDNTAGDGGGLWLAYADALVAHNVIDGNAADDTDPTEAGQGGGVDIQISSDGTYLVNNIITNNVASTHGGGVVVYEYHPDYGEAVVQNNVIAFNAVTETTHGGGLAVWQYTGPDVRNNAIYANSGPGVWLNAASYGAVFAYNDVYANATDYAGDQGSRTGSNGNVSADPRFVAATDDGDVTNDDFSLSATSTLTNAGDSALTDPDGSRSDIGAYGGALGSW
jgi:hypothetical protein